MAFFLLASGAFLSSPALAFQAKEQDFSLASEPSSSSDQDIIPPALRHYLFQCLEKLGEECRPLFFARIFIVAMQPYFVQDLRRLGRPVANS
ncbi:hypothetical protein CK203_064655 [Vitis vinifera]|uniref:Uncharacterized protein n=1 Tax=Vitis vinifera TaxID=29760 RepID=A0A438G9M1_VITVI|nr:hypothetical protein CK203_064655 [Vitis vinifera]